MPLFHAPRLPPNKFAALHLTLVLMLRMLLHFCSSSNSCLRQATLLHPPRASTIASDFLLQGEFAAFTFYSHELKGVAALLQPLRLHSLCQPSADNSVVFTCPGTSSKCGSSSQVRRQPSPFVLLSSLVLVIFFPVCSLQPQREVFKVAEMIACPPR